MITKFRCNLCSSNELEALLEFGEHPIAHRFLDAPDEHEYTHPVRVWLCRECGLTQLVDPIPPEELYTDYNWLSSWKFNPHIPRLLKLISELPGIGPNSAILEVGSNDGSFLGELLKKGYKNLLGMEPARDACAAAAERGIETLPAYFNQQTASELVEARGSFDLIMVRQVLEHVTGLEEFREALKVCLKPGGYCFIEVPNFDFALDASDYSHIWEEHSNYFTMQTLRRFYHDAGLRVAHMETATFSGEIIIAFGVKDIESDEKKSVTFDDLQHQRVRTYKTKYPSFRKAFKNYLENHRTSGGRVAAYGAGCRSGALVNFMGLAPWVECFFDDQAEKQGKFMPGARLPIFPGSELAASDIDLCLLAVNAENEEKVISKHSDFLERGGKFISVHPPSKLLPQFWTEYFK